MPNEDEDFHVPPVSMSQVMSVAAVMVANTIGAFGKKEDTEEELGALHLICLSVFLNQLLMMGKQKEKIASILEALIVELRDAQPK